MTNVLNVIDNVNTTINILFGSINLVVPIIEIFPCLIYGHLVKFGGDDVSKNILIFCIVTAAC